MFVSALIPFGTSFTVSYFSFIKSYIRSNIMLAIMLMVLNAAPLMIEATTLLLLLKYIIGQCKTWLF